jgi:arabinofuranosyltransferase
MGPIELQPPSEMDRVETRDSAAEASAHFRHLPWLLAVALFFLTLFPSGWLCEDAYISFRTVDNFVHGYGLTWNVQERAQTYTHPLWLFFLSAVYFVTREAFYTVIASSMVVSAAAVGLFVWKIARSGASAALGVLTLTASVAFVDYSTSGLENPLTHLLLALFLWLYLARPAAGRVADPSRDRTPFLLSLLAALAAVNRPDTVLLFLPALVHTLFERKSWRCLWSMALGSLPLIFWLGFSLFYYGSPFPNTAFAKLNNGLSTWTLIGQGCYYLWNSLKYDPITLTTIVVGLAIAVWRRKPRDLCVAAGIVLYLLYVVRIGGCHMGGRFLPAPLFAAVCLLGVLRWNSTAARVLAVGAIAALATFAPRSFGRACDIGEDPPLKVILEHGICDDHAYSLSARGLLWPTGPSIIRAYQIWLAEGKAARAIAATRPEGVVIAFPNIGYYGFNVGPNVWVVDEFALADPLLARLPPVYDPYWRLSHFSRAIPTGYLETLQTGKNMLREPGLAEYYDHLALITRGSLWDWRRLTAIWNMNLGRYDHLLEATREKIRTMLPIKFEIGPPPPTAIRDLSARIAAHPKEPLLYAYRGMAHSKQGEYAKAIDDFSRAIAIDPHNPAVYNCRGMAHSKQGEYAKAIDDFSRVIALDPRDPAAYNYRGVQYSQQGETAKALHDFNLALDISPQMGESHVNRAITYYESGDRRRALTDLQRVIDIHPTRRLGYHLMAQVLCGSGDPGRIGGLNLNPPDDISITFGNLAWILATHPDATYRNGAKAVYYAKLTLAVASKTTPESLDTLAAAYAEAGRFSDAVQTAQNALDLAAKQNKAALADRVRARLKLYRAGSPYHIARLDEAIAQYRVALDIAPDDAKAHNDLGLLLFGRGQIDEAMAEYRKALEIKPDFAQAHNNLGLVLAGCGQSDEAIAEYQKALRIKPKFAAAQYNLGNVLLGRGQFDEAVAHYRQALMIEPDDTNTRSNLGAALHSSGKLDEAIAEYRKALEIKPDFAGAHYNLGNALFQSGRLDEAIAQFQQALKAAPNDADAHNRLEFAATERRRLAETIALNRKALAARPDDVAAANNLAWLLATCPAASLRNGNEAVEIARRGERLSAGKQAAVLDTLAAAYAENGRWPEAVQTARRALELASQQDNKGLADALRARVALYEAGKPYRQAPAAGRPTP